MVRIQGEERAIPTLYFVYTDQVGKFGGRYDALASIGDHDRMSLLLAAKAVDYLAENVTQPRLVQKMAGALASSEAMD